MIRKAKDAGVEIGLFGQAPRNFPDYAALPAEQAVDSISFGADELLKGIENINNAELKMNVPA